MTLFKSGNYSEALSEFKRALEIHAGYAEAYFNYALCLLTQAAADNALTEAVKGDLLQHLNRAVELNAYYNNEYLKVAQANLAKNQLAECRQALVEAKTSVSSQTGNVVFHEFYLRLKYGDEGVDRKATERYVTRLEEMLDKNPQYVDVHNDLGVAYLIQCRFLFNRAINEFKRALALNPNYSKAQKNLKLAENEGKGFLILLRAILYF
jgi:tetratricopeptide (TPR) repeat protein